MVKQGQKFALKYITQLGMGHFFGFVTSGYPDGAAILMFTGQSANAEETKNRYLATMAQILLWYEDSNFLGDISSSDVLER